MALIDVENLSVTFTRRAANGVPSGRLRTLVWIRNTGRPMS